MQGVFKYQLPHPEQGPSIDTTFMILFMKSLIHKQHLIFKKENAAEYMLLFATVQSTEPRIKACSVSPSHGLFLTCRGENIFYYMN